MLEALCQLSCGFLCTERQTPQGLQVLREMGNVCTSEFAGVVLDHQVEQLKAVF